MLKLNNELFPAESKTKWQTSEIVKAIHRSQHTQRNYDLSKTIPIEDVKTIITSATQCPSKQNTAFYDLYVITNRSVINQIYETTTSLHTDDPGYARLSNPQVLGNILLVFADRPDGPAGNHKELWESKANVKKEENDRIVLQDKFTAIGIAAGYVNLTASLLGYETGCCSCIMNYERVQEILGIEGTPQLLMGVGFKNEGVNRREHHLKNTQVAKEQGWVEKFGTAKKQQIGIYYIK
jgi:hypothetical protein